MKTLPPAAVTWRRGAEPACQGLGAWDLADPVTSTQDRVSKVPGAPGCRR
ncbi:hypothetical protein ABMX48_37465 [Streptomyces cavourensis]